LYEIRHGLRKAERRSVSLQHVDTLVQALDETAHQATLHALLRLLHDTDRA
jgi:hypothetical protein